jgi:hypothetical protein
MSVAKVFMKEILEAIFRTSTWRKVSSLPDKVEELEERIAKLEGGYKASQEFMEMDGALFKRNPDNSWQQAVFCPRCKTSTELFPGPIGGNVFVCASCDWGSPFTDMELPEILQRLREMDV